MKSSIQRMIAILVLGALASVGAFAKGKKESVALATNIKVNGTLVKKGTYDLVFNEQTGELSIMKGKTVVAKTAARLEKREAKAKTTEVHTTGSGDDVSLLSIVFSGSDQNIVVSGNAAATTGNN